MAAFILSDLSLQLGEPGQLKMATTIAPDFLTKANSKGKLIIANSCIDGWRSNRGTGEGQNQ